MKKVLGEYVFELIILILGLIAGLLEAVLAQNTDLAVSLVAMSTIVGLATASIRREIGERVSDKFDLHQLVEKTPMQWRDEAASEFNQLRLRLQLWAEGMRDIPIKQLLNYEIALVRRASKSINGVYVCLPPEVLQFWSPDHASVFRHFRDGFKTLPDFVGVRQVFVFDSDAIDLSG